MGKLDNVRFVRSVDPDNTVDANYAAGSAYTDMTYATRQSVDRTYDRDEFSMVSAASKPGDDYYRMSGGKKAVISYFSRDPACRVSFGRDWYELHPEGVYDR